MATDETENTVGHASGLPGDAPVKIGALWILEYLAWLAAIVFLAGVFMLAVLSPVLADAPINGEARASNEKGFGRIVINLEELPRFEQEIASGILVLSFEKAVKVDLEPVKESLPDYVGLVRSDPDGKALRFALNRSFQVNVMEAGLELFIDILPPDWQGLPPPLPESTIKALTFKAMEAERDRAEREAQRKLSKIPYKLTFKVARQPTFLRMVFDWNKFVQANLNRTGGWVELKFDQFSDVNFGELRADPPRYLKAIDAVKSDEGMTVQISIDDDVDVRGFREGLSYVVDLTGPDALTDLSAAHLVSKVAGKKNAGDQAPAAAMPEGSKEVAFFAGKRMEPDGQGTRAKSDVTSEVKDVDPAVLSEQSFSIAENMPPAFSGLTDAAVDSAKNEIQVEAADGASPDETVRTESAGADPARDAAMPRAANDAAKSRADSEPRADSILAGSVIRHTFQFASPVSGAVFRRGRSIWAVFDSSEEQDLQDLQDLRAMAGGLVENVKQVAFGDAQYVRIRLATPQLVYVNIAENRWHLAIGDVAAGDNHKLQLVRTLREDDRSLIKVQLDKQGKVHWITDPDIGDRIAVVTAFGPQRNVTKPQEFVDFSAFATAHGIAIRPRTDDLAVRLNLDEVLITRRDGLTLSAGNAGQYDAGRKPLRKSAHAGFIDFKKWTISEPGDLSDKISALQRSIAQASQDRMNGLRFDLATLYTANAFYAESLGLLTRMEHEDGDVNLDPSYKALRGATLVMLNRLEEARRDFEIHALANDTDASLWRSLIAVKEQRWADAISSFKDGADRLAAYRRDLHARFRLGAVRAALESQLLTEAATILNGIPQGDFPVDVSAEYDVLTGRYLDSVGRDEEAGEAYMKAVNSKYEPAVAEARLYSTLLNYKTHRIDRDGALTELERLQLFWRGDDIELRTLRAMASLYAQEKRYQDAFAVMRNSIEAFPKDAIALRIQDDMQEVFKNLFLHGEGDSLDPVKALSLYYGYRNLTPVGRLGDEMIRRLADRLVKVDLLDQASELLDHQVGKRLKGAARAQVATRLAMIHLMNHKPDQALRSIRNTRQNGLPDDLQRDRNMIEARALGELGRAAAAVEILNTMEGETVERLKADAYWSSRNWKNAGMQIEKMLGSRWSDADELTKQERFYVLRAAIAYSLAEDQFALDRLRKKYYPKIVKTPDASSFLVVTKPIKEKDVTFRDLAKEIASIDTLDSFIKEFQSGYGMEDSSPRASAKKPTDNAG